MLEANINVGSSENKQTLQFIGLLYTFPAKSLKAYEIRYFEVHNNERFT